MKAAMKAPTREALGWAAFLVFVVLVWRLRRRLEPRLEPR